MAQHVKPLLEILSASKYKLLSNSSGNPVVPKSHIYIKLSEDLYHKTGKERVSPKYLYVMLKQNIYDLWNKFLEIHNIKKCSASILQLDASEDSILNNSNNTQKINLQLILPFDTWLAMNPENVAYADKKLTERT
ncbi:hypothetical protein PUN28_013942 [Cardiocondyla obscurior]|uniref:Uncharacterized protein n=1 Tax=Cardiocondyla obscurior TaxID=286306 RepID=A0AAW2F725_9HYME